MCLFKKIELKTEYRTPKDNVIKDFFVPLLSNAVSYKRAVGFFSSTALIQISVGISKIVENGGKIKLIASPRLSEEDITAINKGYQSRNELIKLSLLRELRDPKNYFEEQRLNLLATLIANNKLDIKIAFTSNYNQIGIYHEKMGLVYDNYDNIVAFSGSINESQTAFLANYEVIDVFCSWKSDFEKEKVKKKEIAFDSMWLNSDPNIEIIDFPEVVAKELEKYRREFLDVNIDQKEIEKNSQKLVFQKRPKNIPKLPDGFRFYDFQNDAILEWAKQDYVGIYDMATGAGKTYTALGSIIKLFEHCNGKLSVIISCPFQHLVEQWVEDLKSFNIDPIIGYSASSQKDWLKKLDRVVIDQRINVKGSDFFCFICTNTTFASDKVQEKISKIRGNVLLIVDEAHYFGAQGLSKKLSNKINYRLALSATIDRHFNDEETEKLYNYFGKKCIEYTLEKAISDKKLTPYKYYPVIVNLTEEEFEKYSNLSYEINKCIITDSKGRLKLSEQGKILAQQRARVVAAASEKVIELKKIMINYKDKKHILVYCGASNLLGVNEDITLTNNEDIRQIDCITNLLGNDLKIKVSQFTSKENIVERQVLKKEFEKGDFLQVLIAIKCLDEGVNIPKIKTAFILASTTNPKEYIQRRGRVLRLAEGKDFAEIYDFITLPRPLNEVNSHTVEELKYDLSLIKKELSRAEEFARISINSMEVDSILRLIKETYNINNFSASSVENIEQF